jgi:hypothetical protein
VPKSTNKGPSGARRDTIGIRVGQVVHSGTSCGGARGDNIGIVVNQVAKNVTSETKLGLWLTKLTRM